VLEGGGGFIIGTGRSQGQVEKDLQECFYIHQLPQLEDSENTEVEANDPTPNTWRKYPYRTFIRLVVQPTYRKSNKKITYTVWHLEGPDWLALTLILLML
jgi:hypothetical protein